MVWLCTGVHWEDWKAPSRDPWFGAALRLAVLQASHTLPEEQAPVTSVAEGRGCAQGLRCLWKQSRQIRRSPQATIQVYSLGHSSLSSVGLSSILGSVCQNRRRRQTMNNPSRVQDTRCVATSSEGEGCRLRTRPRPRLCRGGRGPGAVGCLGRGRDPRPLRGKGQGLCP